MNAESFIQYVKQLSRLYQLPYEELKSLSMQYPYFQNLHLLLALKSKLEDHEDYERNLARASTYSNDRAQLYRTLTKLEKLALEENFLLQEDFLELQEIQQVEEKLKELEIVPEEENDQGSDPLSFEIENKAVDTDHQESGFHPVLDDQDELEDELIPEIQLKQEENQFVQEALPTNTKNKNEQILNITKQAKDIAAIIGITKNLFPQKSMSQEFNDPVLTLKPLDKKKKKKELKERKTSTKTKKPRPMPKQSFSSWVEQFQPAYVKPHLNELMESKKRDMNNIPQVANDHVNATTADQLEVLAEKSIMENEEMASETLAELLTAQMQYQKAIQVYERLILIFPEKSSFFADKIENLKKLIA